MAPTVINLAEKLSRIDVPWSPGVVAELNDYRFKLVKVQGDVVWHKHDHTDEVFLVQSDDLRIDFRDGTLHLHPGEMTVVPRGVEHRPHAASECHVLLIEPRGVANSGDAGGDRTAPDDIWV